MMNEFLFGKVYILAYVWYLHFLRHSYFNAKRTGYTLQDIYKIYPNGHWVYMAKRSITSACLSLYLCYFVLSANNHLLSGIFDPGRLKEKQTRGSNTNGHLKFTNFRCNN